MNKNKKIIGLIGGMGPFASIELCKRLLEKSVKNFGAKSCDDFPEIVLDSIPIPDFISDTGNLPIATKTLVSRVNKLNRFGCTTIAMVCNTGHILFPILSKVSNAEMVSLIKIIRNKVTLLKFKRVGLLATKTTINSNIFQEEFKNTGIKIVIPNQKDIDTCEKLIREVIANKNFDSKTNQLQIIIQRFIKEKGLGGVILGCTELPLVLQKNKLPNIVDCLDVLSDELLTNYFSN